MFLNGYTYLSYSKRAPPVTTIDEIFKDKIKNAVVIN